MSETMGARLENLRIVAVGGGHAFEDTDRANREVLRMAGGTRPRVLFIPTASGDSSRYVLRFARYFSSIGADPDVLPTVNESASPQMIAQAVQDAAAVYVGGGSTLKMMASWKRTGVAAELISAAARGKVLAGLSAGANCWFKLAQAATRKPPKDREFVCKTAKCLGLLNAHVCTHFSSEPERKPFFEAAHKWAGAPGIAIDDGCALIVDRGSVRVVAQKPGMGISVRREGKSPARYLDGATPRIEDIFGANG